jgi:CRISPR/Cas system CSM-associated protein Csm4 (group 5 of RAMP superfamily)
MVLPSTCDVQALLVFAYDLFQLLHRGELPKRFLDRLRSYKEFQGATYEVVVATIFVRAWFKIKFENERSKNIVNSLQLIQEQAVLSDCC